MFVKNVKWLAALLLVLSLMLAACGADTQQQVEDAAQQIEEAAEELQPTIEAAAEELQPTVEAAVEAVQPTIEAAVEEIQPTVEAAVEEVVEEATAMVEEPTEEPTEEPAAELAVDPTGQTVVFWHVWGAGSAAEGLAQIVQAFNDTNEWGITVEPVDQGGQGDLQDAVNAAIATGELPNVTPGFPNAIATWHNVGAIAELNDFINDPNFGLSQEELDAIYEANLAAGRLADGTQIGMPIHQSANVLFYNHTWAQELGFAAPPTTSAEFKEQACAATAANNEDDNPDNDGTGGLVTRGIGASDVAAWLFAFDGGFLNETGDAYNMNTEQMKEVALFLKDLRDSGCWFTTEGFPNPEFAGRQALFAISSTAGIPFQATAFEDAGSEDEWGLTAFPGPDGKLAINAFGQLIGVIDQNPEANLASWVWLKHFTSPEVQAEWINFSAYHPSQTTTEQFMGDYIEANPIYATGLELSQYGEAEPNLASWGVVRNEISDSFNAIVAATDEAEIDQLLADLDAAAAQALADSQ
jgi:multiple sugar transport system substrate-binding protein/sn-glycerol 3-phosphate transport system substrate-binding protein